MKRRNLLVLLILALLISAGCKKKEDSNGVVGSFTLKGEKYEIISEGSAPTGILQLIHSLDDGTTSGSIAITGNSSSATAMLQIVIDYKTSAGVAGEYKNGDNFDGDHLFDPWMSSYSTIGKSGTNMISGNSADGTMTVIKNSDDNYTVTFNFVFSDNTTASGSITQKYTVQEMNL